MTPADLESLIWHITGRQLTGKQVSAIVAVAHAYAAGDCAELQKTRREILAAETAAYGRGAGRNREPFRPRTCTAPGCERRIPQTSKRPRLYCCDACRARAWWARHKQSGRAKPVEPAIGAEDRARIRMYSIKRRRAA